MQNSEQVAFPCIDSQAGIVGKEYSGLTKREYIAAKLFAGMLADSTRESIECCADMAVKGADFLLKSLEK